MVDYVHVVVRQQTAPANPKSGWIWIKIDAAGNDIQAFLYIGNVWTPFA